MSWAVFQIGAREHYAIARALHRSRQKVTLYSDVLARPLSSILFPKRWKSRWHSELNSMRTVSANLSAVRLETYDRIFRPGAWQRILNRNEWFGEKMSSAFRTQIKSGERPTVFAYSYAAKRIFEVAKSVGCKCILGQIDPGPGEMRIVEALAKQWGDLSFTKPPASYWDNWRIECDLADKIVVNSEWSRELLAIELGSPEKIEVIPLAYERTSKTESTAVPIPAEFNKSRPLKILFLGQVVLRKGVKEMAEAIRITSNLPIEWSIIGNGPAHLLKELAECPNTKVIGGVSRDEAAEWYAQSDVFILPTHSDGYAITQLEAAAFRLPIIASRYCGAVVRDGKNGIVLPSVTAQSISDAVVCCVKNPQKVRAMQMSQLEQPFTLSELAKRLIDLQSSL